MILWLLACSDYGYSDARWTDTFQQDAANAVDLLVVIDNSCSMVEEQDNLARNFDALLQQFVDAGVDWQIGVATTDVEDENERGQLQGGDDEVILRGPGGELDRVEYDRSWGFSTGVSKVLSAESTTPGANDQLSNWCDVQVQYGSSGERGTPGVHQRRCNGLLVNGPPPGPDRGPRAPVAGDLVFTELHPQAFGDDRLCEWLELTNPTDDTVQLGGLELFDLGRNRAVLPELLVAPRQSIVIGRSLTDNCDTPVDVALGPDLTLNDDVRTITGDQLDAAELFAENVAQGTRGTGIELGLEGARLVLSEPYYTIDNGAWLRDEAKLALLFVSDEDDLSPLSVDGYLDHFAQVKGLPGYRDPGRVSVSAVVGNQRPPRPDLPACQSDNGSGAYAERYLAAANRTGGLVESICAEDFAPIITDLGLTLSGLTLRFGLSRTPKLDTLEVRLYADNQGTLVGELILDEDFTYDAEQNDVVFTQDQAPPSDTYLAVSYVEQP